MFTVNRRWLAFVLVGILFLCAQIAFSADFRNSSWGDTIQQVTAAEGSDFKVGNYPKDENRTLIYSREVLGVKLFVCFGFNDDQKLQKGWYLCKNWDNLDDYNSLFPLPSSNYWATKEQTSEIAEKLKLFLENKYGPGILNSVNWETDEKWHLNNGTEVFWVWKWGLASPTLTVSYTSANWRKSVGNPKELDQKF